MHSQGLQGQVEEALEFITLQAPSGSSIFPKLTPPPPRHGLPNSPRPSRLGHFSPGRAPTISQGNQGHRQVVSVRKILVPDVLHRD